jgi:hypothetical protein
VLKINTRAERKVDKELNAELKKIRGKEGMLLRVAELLVDHRRTLVAQRTAIGKPERPHRAAGPWPGRPGPREFRRGLGARGGRCLRPPTGPRPRPGLHSGHGRSTNRRNPPA